MLKDSNTEEERTPSRSPFKANGGTPWLRHCENVCRAHQEPGLMQWRQTKTHIISPPRNTSMAETESPKSWSAFTAFWASTFWEQGQLTPYWMTCIPSLSAPVSGFSPANKANAPSQFCHGQKHIYSPWGTHNLQLALHNHRLDHWPPNTPQSLLCIVMTSPSRLCLGLEWILGPSKAE